MKPNKKLFNSIVAMLILISMALGMLPNIGYANKATEGETHKVSGTVYNDLMDTLADAKVVIEQNGAEITSTRTLEDGTYSLELANGTYDIYIYGSAFLRSTSSTDLKEVTKKTITIDSNDLEENIRIDRLNNCNKVSGLVTDKNTGKPINTAYINMGASYPSFSEYSASTDENGRYEIYGALSGMIHARKNSSYDFNMYESLVDGLNSYSAASEMQTLDFSGTKSFNIDFELDIPTEQRIFGKVLNMGQPLKDININILYKDRNNRETLLGTMPVSETGEFEFNGLYGGEVDVVVANGDKLYSTRYTNRHVVLSGKDEEINYELCKITGRVKDKNGKDIESYTVSVTDKISGKYLGSTNRRGNDDASYEYKYVTPGIYTIGATWYIGNAGTAAGQEEKVFVERTIKVTGIDVVVDLQQGQDYEMDAHFKYSISGTIYNSITNNPLPNAKVIIKSGTGAEIGTIITDRSGKFKFQDILEGIYTVTAVYKEKEKTVDVNLFGSDRQVDIALEIPLLNEVTINLDSDKVVNFTVDGAEDSHKVTGTVTDSNTKDPLPGAKVEIKNKDGDVVGEATTGPDGSYEITGLPDGDYTITVTYPDPTDPTKNITKDVPVTVDGGDKRVDIELNIPKKDINTPVDKKYNISGTIKQEDGSTHVTSVVLYDASGKEITHTTCKPDGTYKFTGLAPGVYTVEAYKYGNTTGTPGGEKKITVSKSVTIVDTDKVVDLQFKNDVPVNPPDKVYKITGTIKDSNGIILNGITVRLIDQSGRVISTTSTNGRGEYEFTGLNAGVYKVEASYKGSTASASGTIIDRDIQVNITIQVKSPEKPGTGDKPEPPEEKPNKPEDNPNKPEDKPGTPETPETPEEKPGTAEEKPGTPEEKPGTTEIPKEKPGTTETPEEQPGKPEEKPGTPTTDIEEDGVPGGNKEPEDPNVPDNEHEIAGVVVDSDTDLPIPGTDIKVKDKDGNEIGPIKTKDDGTFTIPGLPDGDYIITVTYPDPTDPTKNIIEEVKVTIDNSDEKVVIGLDIPKPTPDENHNIIGEVIDQNDNHLPGVTVKIYENGKLISEVGTDKDGNFIISNIPNGTYRLVTSYKDPSTGDNISESIEVTISNQDEKVTVRLNIPEARTGASSIFNDKIKQILMIAAFSLLLLLGIGLLWLLFIAWYRRVKVFNDINIDPYKEEDWDLVYKNYVRKEDQEEKIYYINIPKGVFDERATDSFKVVLKKLFVKRHNGDMFIVRIIDKDNNNAIIKSYSFEIDKEDNEIDFTYDDTVSPTNM